MPHEKDPVTRVPEKPVEQAPLPQPPLETMNWPKIRDHDRPQTDGWDD